MEYVLLIIVGIFAAVSAFMPKCKNKQAVKDNLISVKRNN